MDKSWRWGGLATLIVEGVATRLRHSSASPGYEQDDPINPLGIEGVGEIGIVATAAAIANAVYHATGKRVRDLLIAIDKLARE